MKTGYKGVTMTGTGAFYAPYIPKLNLSWQTHLNLYRTNVVTGTSGTTEPLVETATKELQSKFPGPYVVEEFYNAKVGRFDLRLKFEDPKEKTMWLLKWS
jgi:hypothetical protein